MKVHSRSNRNISRSHVARIRRPRSSEDGGSDHDATDDDTDGIKKV